MKLSDKDIEQINLYLDDQLQGSVLEEFQRRLTDEKFYAQFIEIKEMRQGIRLSVLNDKMSLLQKLESKMVDRDIQNNVAINIESKVRILPKWTKWLAAAMMIGVIAIAGIKMMESPGHPSEKYAHMFGDDFEKNHIKHKVMRASDFGDLTPEQSRAFALYSDKQFDRAIPFLKELWEENQDSLALEYLGISYLGVGEDEKGEEILGEIIFK